MSLILFKYPEDEPLFNYNATHNVEVTQMMGTFSLSLKESNKDNDYKNEILKSRFNMCKLEGGVRANFLTKMLMENFQNASDFSFNCPMKAGPFSITNFKMTDNAFPTYLFTNEMNFMMMLKTQVKIPNAKGLINFQTIKFYGELKK